MTKSKLILLLLAFLLTQNIQAEKITQVIRGVIKDKDSQMELIGVNIALFKDSALISGAITDLEGSYRIENVPLGRYIIRYSYHHCPFPIILTRFHPFTHVVNIP